MSTLHIHLDESGDWTFNSKGSRYFVLAVAWTYNPRPLAEALTSLRFGLVKQGHNIESFHTAPDKQATRDAVVRTLAAFEEWHFAALVVEKRKVNPRIREPQRFYPTFAGMLLRFVLRGRMQPGTDHVLVFADTIPMDSSRKREGVLKAIKTTLAAELKPEVGHHVFSHRRDSNEWIQAVDYCCWSVYRKWEGSDSRTYDRLRVRIAAPELDVCASGDQTVYY